MADYRALWGDHLDTAEREPNRFEWMQFAARSYRRECTQEADEAVARLEADRNFRPSIVDCNRAYDAWAEAFAAEGVIIEAGSEFRTMREVIDAEIAESRLYRLANFTRATWEENMERQQADREKQRAYRIQYGRPPRPVRVKRAPTKYVRGPNGTKIPRSKSHVTI